MAWSPLYAACLGICSLNSPMASGSPRVCSPLSCSRLTLQLAGAAGSQRLGWAPGTLLGAGLQDVACRRLARDSQVWLTQGPTDAIWSHAVKIWN